MVVDRQTDRQKDKHTERQTYRKTERQKDRKRERQTDTVSYRGASLLKIKRSKCDNSKEPIFFEFRLPISNQ